MDYIPILITHCVGCTTFVQLYWGYTTFVTLHLDTIVFTFSFMHCAFIIMGTIMQVSFSI